jgi:sugar lactone lactonase YvrE
MTRASLLVFFGLTACAPPDARGVLYVADLQGGAVRAFDAASGADLGVIVEADDLPDGVAPRGFEPSAVAAVDDGLLVTNFTDGSVLLFDTFGGFERVVYDNASAPPGVRLEEPCGVRVVGRQALVLGNDTHNVVVLDLDDGSVGQIGVDDEGRSLRSAHGIDVGPDGLLYVATSPTTRDAGLIQVWDPDGNTWLRDFAPWPSLGEGTGIVAEPAGTVLVVDWFGGRAVRYDAATGDRVLVLAAALQQPVSLTYAADGGLYVLDATGVIELDPESGAALRTVVPADLAGFVWPRSIAAGG